MASTLNFVKFNLVKNSDSEVDSNVEVKEVGISGRREKATARPIQPKIKTTYLQMQRRQTLEGQKM